MINYQKIGVIGQGAFGIVYKVKRNQQFYALKQPLEKGNTQQTLRQLRVLLQLKKHKYKHCAKLITFFESNNKNILVFQYYDTDLKKLINIGISNQTKKRILKQILLGIQQLHKHRIFHRDLKPQNIFITQNKQVKIGDFGLARNFQLTPHQYTNQIATICYKPPETFFANKVYSKEIDIWQFGCIAIQMYHPLKHQAFRCKSQLEIIFKMLSIYGKEECLNLWQNYESSLQLAQLQVKGFSGHFNFLDSGVLDLSRKCLELNPQKRITLEQAINHQFFKQ